VNSEQQRELDREQWCDLVRGLSLVQAGGYPGCVSISKRFLRSPDDEVELMARMGRHIVQEYGLKATIEVSGNAVLLRIEKAETPASEPQPAGSEYVAPTTGALAER
jgi:hypothetical protein